MLDRAVAPNMSVCGRGSSADASRQRAVADAKLAAVSLCNLAVEAVIAREHDRLRPGPNPQLVENVRCVIADRLFADL